MSDSPEVWRQWFAKAVLELLYKDPHQWSERPCPTCTAISALVGEPFGCTRFAKEKAKRRAGAAAGRRTER